MSLKLKPHNSQISCKNNENIWKPSKRKVPMAHILNRCNLVLPCYLEKLVFAKTKITYYKGSTNCFSIKNYSRLPCYCEGISG